MLSKSYWSNNGKYQKSVDRLHLLIPIEGSVPNTRKNRKLEKLRKACNCYHYLYNNGLCNRVNEFRQVFGIASSKYIRYDRGNNPTDDLFIVTEEAMNIIIKDAAIEQGLLDLITEDELLWENA